jgi:hypothetical protein
MRKELQLTVRDWGGVILVENRALFQVLEQLPDLQGQLIN